MVPFIAATKDYWRLNPSLLGQVAAAHGASQVVDVDDRVLGHPRAPVLAAPWVPVDAMERGDQGPLLVHDLS
jgi:hypothetical protein